LMVYCGDLDLDHNAALSYQAKAPRSIRLQE
jgi:hypothetical protein